MGVRYTRVPHVRGDEPSSRPTGILPMVVFPTCVGLSPQRSILCGAPYVEIQCKTSDNRTTILNVNMSLTKSLRRDAETSAQDRIAVSVAGFQSYRVGDMALLHMGGEVSNLIEENYLIYGTQGGQPKV